MKCTVYSVIIVPKGAIVTIDQIPEGEDICEFPLYRHRMPKKGVARLLLTGIWDVDTIKSMFAYWSAHSVHTFDTSSTAFSNRGVQYTNHTYLYGVLRALTPNTPAVDIDPFSLQC